jgi:hypothetical protein
VFNTETSGALTPSSRRHGACYDDAAQGHDELQALRRHAHLRLTAVFIALVDRHPLLGLEHRAKELDHPQRGASAASVEGLDACHVYLHAPALLIHKLAHEWLEHAHSKSGVSSTTVGSPLTKKRITQEPEHLHQQNLDVSRTNELIVQTDKDSYRYVSSPSRYHVKRLSSC